MIYFQIYLCIINILAIVICITDKIKAQHNMWRIKEKTLFLISTLGGAVGMYATMLIVRHKTKHIKFMLGLPFLILLQCLVVIMAFRCTT